MNPVILYRKYESEYEEDEIDCMKRYFPITSHRTDLKKDDLVIGRYSVLPFYKEQEEDIKNIGASLINTYAQHRYIADMGNWYQDLEFITPKSWPGINWVDEDGPYVLKGETNSRRQKWFTHMYAKDFDAVHRVYEKLRDDALLSNQTIWIRKFEEFKNYGNQVNGLPISDEYRFFICDNQILSGGFYWTSCMEDIVDSNLGIPDVSRVPREFIRTIIKAVGNKARFYAVDVAQKSNNEWTVVELNDGQMSGLSENKADDVFRNLQRVLSGKESDFK
jgi:hypothetical protein